ncbi:hypothetical protein Moror_8835 [Moniliophthora roreri MCA 2997]|uniref:Uncharacterized protein n=1 Tax=Moniliophthora roreri (strain MCA 2997) TaxID=1381753 RepID=V2XHD9_MONRO|nr:hypothetical protein Moror_8835 [Moniliophthora roreri MCA 2997]
MDGHCNQSHSAPLGEVVDRSRGMAWGMRLRVKREYVDPRYMKWRWGVSQQQVRKECLMAEVVEESANGGTEVEDVVGWKMMRVCEDFAAA